MKAEQLLELIGQARDEHIREAWEAKRRIPAWIRAVAACAALVLLAAAGGAVSLLGVECRLLDVGNGAALAGVSVARAEETELWGRSFQSETAPREKTVIFDGKQYTGTYRYSIYGIGRGVAGDCYESSDTEAGWVSFSVSGETGELWYINFYAPETLSREAEKQGMDRLAVEEQARLWASHFIDPSDYRMRQTYFNRDDSGFIVYEYTFVRMVGDYDTMDRITVMLTDRGTLLQAGGSHVGWTKGKGLALARLRLIDPRKELEQALEGRSFQLQKCTYAITPEGKVVILASCVLPGKFGNTAATFVIG